MVLNHRDEYQCLFLTTAKWLQFVAAKATQEQCSCNRKKKKIEAVSETVWICLKAVIAEKTIKEKWRNKNNFENNYN